MRANVYLSELLDAFQWVSAGGASDNAAYVSRESGRICWAGDVCDLEEELPEDVEETRRCMPAFRISTTSIWGKDWCSALSMRPHPMRANGSLDADTELPQFR